MNWCTEFSQRAMSDAGFHIGLTGEVSITATIPAQVISSYDPCILLDCTCPFVPGVIVKLESRWHFIG